jgi:hypothetical protein
MIIFLDESGDLGFDFENKRPSSHFVITLLVCDGREVVQGMGVAIRRTLKNKLNHKKAERKVRELKGSETALPIKEYFVRHCPDTGWRLYSVTLNKQRVASHLKTRDGRKKLYNFLSRFLIEKIPFREDLSDVTLVVDKCKNTNEMKDFNQYIENHMQALLPLECRLYISHEQSHQNPGLQAVDMFCWGFARKYTDGTEWYGMFRERVAFETVYLPKRGEV